MKANDANDEWADLPSGIRLCYRDIGQGEPILLIIGLGYQLIHWPQALIQALCAAGHRVIVFDNRDSGRSSRVPGPELSLWQKLRGQAPAGSYSLGVMAADVLGLLDHLKIERVDVIGMSLGGMIGQVFAARHPQRVKHLVSIFSTTGARRVGQPSLRMKLQFAKPAPRTREDYIARNLQSIALVGGRDFPSDLEANRELFGHAWDRAQPDLAHATTRQIGAIYASGDRTREVAMIEAPTLVVHGDRDPLVHPSGGEATARAIKGSRHVVIPGMGHEISPALCPRLAPLILDHLGEPTR